MGAHQTKSFKSRNSEAVRLPQGVGFGREVNILRRSAAPRPIAC